MTLFEYGRTCIATTVMHQNALKGKEEDKFEVLVGTEVKGRKYKVQSRR